MTVPAGTSCAVVGTSGSGKSTLLRLLFRFYDPSAGTVRISGHNLKDLTMQSLRSRVGSVPQVSRHTRGPESRPVSLRIAGDQ